MSRAYVIWFTGLSGSGKTTLANNLSIELKKRNLAVEVIDGDKFREKMHPNLKFLPKDIDLNNKKIVEYCLSNAQKNSYFIVPVIAPFNKIRKYARNRLGKKYIEIYCKASLATCIKRDVKGLYAKAYSGEIQNFVGVDKKVPYEVPQKPDFVINTESLNKKKSIEKIIQYLESIKII